MVYSRACIPFVAVLVAACSGVGDNTAPAPLAAKEFSPAASVGRAIFDDTALSVSGQQSCATCHDAAHAFAAGDGAPVPLGGARMDRPGFRNAPSLMYASLTPHYRVGPGGPVGGFFRDGRASTLAVQAEQPFLTQFEMANDSAAALLARLRTRPYFATFAALYGADAQDPAQALTRVGEAVAAYESEDAAFHPFTSKYDYALLGQATLSAQERRGRVLFNNPGRGNCTACHPSQVGPYSEHALFTDFTYDNIPVPRNWAIPANRADPVSPVDGTPLSDLPASGTVPADAEYRFYDLGLCGPFMPPAQDPNPRPDPPLNAAACGQFKVPTLRNVAMTAPYFHNGVFASLREAVEWYVTREIGVNTGNNPAPQRNPYAAAGTFFVDASRQPDRFLYNDVPLEDDGNVNTHEAPYLEPASLGGRAPVLTSAEIDDLVAFLCTLSDGYDPAHPSTYPVPAQCAAVQAP